jgi:iron-sulfur cluster assembly protein
MVRRRAALAAALAAISSMMASAFAPCRAPAARANAPAARRRTRRASTETTAEPATDTSSYVITITPEAQDHIAKLRAAEGPGTHLRMGVKAGGCSGMSYAMDLCKEDDITEQDHVEEWPEGFKVVIDPKSMLYLFGLELGYSNELIGGGFQFKNPNAETSCGCGTSFGI